jgi:DNA-binding response OmpR family regulator
VSLTSKEFRILAVLAGHPKKTFTREELISGAFPEGYDGFDRAMDTYVKNIRKKLAETDSTAINPTPEPMEYIRTVHGVGYRMGDLP